MKKSIYVKTIFLLLTWLLFNSLPVYAQSINKTREVDIGQKILDILSNFQATLRQLKASEYLRKDQSRQSREQTREIRRRTKEAMEQAKLHQQQNKNIQQQVKQQVRDNKERIRDLKTRVQMFQQ